MNYTQEEIEQFKEDAQKWQNFRNRIQTLFTDNAGVYQEHNPIHLTQDQIKEGLAEIAQEAYEAA